MSTSFWKPLDAFENSSSVSANDQYATQVMRYQYDGLNRLKNAMANRKYSRDDNQWTGDVQGSAYFNSFVYDGNGNILNQVRNNGGSQQVDNLNYQYQKNAEGMLVRNRLYNVGGLDGTQDVATETVDVDGIYKYDELGQLHSDLHDGIDKIVWRVDGKIEGVYHTSESGKPNLQFVYDAMGNRVAKKVINQNGDVKITYYIRDASGNVMSVYERGSAGNSQYMRLTEQHIYGSTRLGMRSADVNIEGNSAEGGLLNVLDVSLLGRPSIRLSRGEKKYELCNHLGNVLMTITDRKLIAVGEHEVYYTAHVVHFSDYYPFGLPMKDETDEYGDRYFQSSADGYRYAFNGKELDNQGMGGGSSTYDYGSRIYNPRLGKFMSVDPKASKFPSWSPYAFCLNNTILLMDPDGQEPIKPQAGTVSGFIAFLNNTSTKMGTLRGSAAQEAMFRLAKIDWSGGKPTPATTAPFNLQADRYIYTEKGGWIDMSHFMFYAGTAYKYKQEKLAAQKAIDNLSSGPIPSTRIPDALYNTAAMDPVGEAVQDGYQQEMTDKVFAKWSSYSYEDLPTDKFAADFGANYFDPNSKLSFGEQIQNYLNNNLKANTPDKAPNYNSLPSVEPTEKPSRTNHSTKPVYTADNP
jgi:RHS repeat-associated protein